MSGDVAGGGGGVAMHEELAGNVNEAEGATEDDEQIPESGDSAGVAGRGHVPSLKRVLYEKRREESKRFAARAKAAIVVHPAE